MGEVGRKSHPTMETFSLMWKRGEWSGVGGGGGADDGEDFLSVVAEAGGAKAVDGGEGGKGVGGQGGEGVEGLLGEDVVSWAVEGFGFLLAPEAESVDEGGGGRGDVPGRADGAVLRAREEVEGEEEGRWRWP